MLFNSLAFAVFLVVCLAVYHLLPHRAQNRWLLAASYFFYGAWDWRFLGLILLSTIIDYSVGLALARRADGSMDRQKLLHEIFCNQGVVLMSGALLIGYWAGAGTAPLMPLFGDLFHGALALFLLEMGMVAASRLPDIRQVAPFMSAFGVIMPLVGTTMGGLLGMALGFSAGGTESSRSKVNTSHAMVGALPTIFSLLLGT